MITKNDLIILYRKEFATTLRVMEAYPADQSDFKPHERSSDTIKLMSTFVFEMYLVDSHLFGQNADATKFSSYKPSDTATIIKDFTSESSAILSKLEQLPEENLSQTISFAGREFQVGDFALMMLLDQIHHRGQLSVYIRLAGGKVPSIYGPSADDNSTNL